VGNNEYHSPDSTPGNHHHISPELLEAFKHSDYNAREFNDELKRSDGELVLALDTLAERIRQQGPYSSDFKAGFLMGALAIFKIKDMEKQSEALAAILNLPSHIDELHTPTTDPPLSA
jgi:hypothetical protein